MRVLRVLLETMESSSRNNYHRKERKERGKFYSAMVQKSSILILKLPSKNAMALPKTVGLRPVSPPALVCPT